MTKATITTKDGSPASSTCFHYNLLIVVFAAVLALGRPVVVRQEDDWLDDLAGQTWAGGHLALAAAMKNLGADAGGWAMLKAAPVAQVKVLLDYFDQDRRLTKVELLDLMKSVFDADLIIELPTDFGPSSVTMAVFRRVWRETLQERTVVCTEDLCDFADALADEAEWLADIDTALHRPEAAPVPTRNGEYGYWRNSFQFRQLDAALTNLDLSLTDEDLALEIEAEAALDQDIPGAEDDWYNYTKLTLPYQPTASPETPPVQNTAGINSLDQSFGRSAAKGHSARGAPDPLT